MHVFNESGTISQQEWEVAYLYCIIEFKKLQPWGTVPPRPRRFDNIKHVPVKEGNPLDLSMFEWLVGRAT